MSTRLINKLGRPDVSSFSTFAYSAGLHLDDDNSVSHGWVLTRDTNHVSEYSLNIHLIFKRSPMILDFEE
jgi:hypothetical protein